MRKVSLRIGRTEEMPGTLQIAVSRRLGENISENTKYVLHVTKGVMVNADV
jgi:hypothetical protein